MRHTRKGIAGSNPALSASTVPEWALSYAGFSDQRLEQTGLRSHHPDYAGIDLDALGERAQVVAAIAAAFEPDAPARRAGEGAEHLRRDRLAPRVLKHGLGALGIGLGLIANDLEAVDAV